MIIDAISMPMMFRHADIFAAALMPAYFDAMPPAAMMP